MISTQVRNYWKNKPDEDGAERFRSFLELWRRKPKDVLQAVDAGRAALAWLRRVAAARILDIVAACVEMNQCVGCTRQFFTKMTWPRWLRRVIRNDIATPSSRRRVDGAEVDQPIQHEGAVKF